MRSISHLIFDFGGCIDAPGIHTRVLFWDAFSDITTVEKLTFQEAYTVADLQMMKTGEAKDLGLKDFNRWNARLIASQLKISEQMAQRAGDAVTEKMHGYLAESRSHLEDLKEIYPLSVISNFTGNLKVILKEYELIGLFETITESYYEGVSKPDSRIFHSAQKKIDLPSSALLYVGDNPKNDIQPAKAMGWSAIIIGNAECKDADERIFSLGELKTILS